MIITIDGASASGKGTLAIHLAQHFHYPYLDTGALYRTVGLILMEKGQDPENEILAQTAAESLKIEEMPFLQNNPKLRNEQVASYAAKVSSIPGVRKALFNFQRRFALSPVRKDGSKANGAILDGRDVGTNICPEAEIKLFLKASSEIRAQRRLKELQEKGFYAIYDTILSEIEERDERDARRTIAPLRPASDALIVDTSDMTANDVFATVIQFIKGKQF